MGMKVLWYVKKKLFTVATLKKWIDLKDVFKHNCTKLKLLKAEAKIREKTLKSEVSLHCITGVWLEEAVLTRL